MKKDVISIIAVAVIAIGCTKTPEYDATGIFEATTVTVSSETAGKITSLPVSEGDSVKADELIATVDSTLYTLQIAQIMSQRQSAKTISPDISLQSASLRAQIAHQEQELERQSRLLASGATTQKNYDDVAAALATLKGQLEGQLSALGKNRISISENAEALTYQIDQVKEQISKCRILSPITATVLEKYVEPGEYIVPGKPLVKLANLDEIYLRSYFTVSQLADIKVGDKVTVIADFGGEKQYEYPGRITWIAQESEFTPKNIQTKDSRANLVYAVKISVKNDGRLKLGQYGEVRL